MQSNCRWLVHPKYPDFKVLVCRSRLGWLIKSSKYATKKEIQDYLAWCVANRRDVDVPTKG